MLLRLVVLSLFIAAVAARYIGDMNYGELRQLVDDQLMQVLIPRRLIRQEGVLLLAIMELAEAIEIPQVNGVFLREGPRQATTGTICVAGHHLMFAPDAQSPTVKGQKDDATKDIWILHRMVDKVVAEPIAKDDPSRGGLLVLKLKNFLILTFEIRSLADCQALFRSIEKLSNLRGFHHEYPFYYRVPFTILDDGWTAFDLDNEFTKLSVLAPDQFRISSANVNFALCQSYPEKVIVPKGIGDDYLGHSAEFREGRRFPVLSYYHAPTKSPIMRCGQPLVGPTNRRCKGDETILNTLLTTERGVIVDTRPKNVGADSKRKGGGCESQQFYSQWKYLVFGTPRIKDMHDALAKAVELCNDARLSSDRFISRAQSSMWYHAITDILTASANVASLVSQEGTTGVPVVVHGGEGTDSTLAVCSLAQLILDADSRTIRGFESLIEREWICAGHPFSSRNAHSAYGSGAVTGPKESPVFLVFLHCVYELLVQFPLSFEFTEEFLILLFEHSYASEFGSFLGDNEMEKRQWRVKECTASLWSYVNNPKILAQFVNSNYEPNDKVIWPSVTPQSFVLWRRVFLRWQVKWEESDAVRKAAADAKLKEKALQSRVHSLKRQIADLTREASLITATAEGLKLTE
ncbi:hypothetical protein PENTCL1PPCAC_29126 [Pristionchus entomophagus]|uniref:Myotubularin phosphatase domain-containing protein n=1 Tax=Pristionchus entomophagus TaxID=358040 RepID=A0AAV5UJ09_9BILA|nr:hypothetical protein PENTCL1PPCAC_29126 [Pristionchus entomophagus]